MQKKEGVRTDCPWFKADGLGFARCLMGKGLEGLCDPKDYCHRILDDPVQREAFHPPLQLGIGEVEMRRVI